MCSLELLVVGDEFIERRLLVVVHLDRGIDDAHSSCDAMVAITSVRAGILPYC